HQGVFQEHHCPFCRARSLFNPCFQPTGALNRLIQKTAKFLCDVPDSGIHLALCLGKLQAFSTARGLDHDDGRPSSLYVAEVVIEVECAICHSKASIRTFIRIWNENMDMTRLPNLPSPAESERHSRLLGPFPRESLTLDVVRGMPPNVLRSVDIMSWELIFLRRVFGLRKRKYLLPPLC